MTWTAFRTRGEILRAVADEADLRLDGTLPLDLPGVPETFRDELDLVGALQLRWYTRLSGRVDLETARRPRDLEGAVRRAWVATAERSPGVRAVLDAQRESPATEETGAALERATEKERAMLARAAGLAGLGHTRADDEQAAVLGCRIEADARAVLAGDEPSRSLPVDAVAARDRLVTGSAAFVARLKAALAA